MKGKYQLNYLFRITIQSEQLGTSGGRQRAGDLARDRVRTARRERARQIDKVQRQKPERLFELSGTVATYIVYVPARASHSRDVRRIGVGDAATVVAALEHHGLNLSTAEAGRIMSSYDDKPNGKLDLSEFAQVIQDLSAADEARRGSMRARFRESS